MTWENILCLEHCLVPSCRTITVPLSWPAQHLHNTFRTSEETSPRKADTVKWRRDKGSNKRDGFDLSIVKLLATCLLGKSLQLLWNRFSHTKEQVIQHFLPHLAKPKNASEPPTYTRLTVARYSPTHIVWYLLRAFCK